MKEIELYRRIGNGRWGNDIPLGISAKVDDDDYERLVEFHLHWRLHSAGYACCTKRVNNKSVVFLMHRVMLGTTDKAIHTDHVDHDRLNNQKSNIVACTQADNNKNLPFNGVGRHRDKWRAFTPSPSKHIGVFNTKEEAERAVKKWLQEH